MRAGGGGAAGGGRHVGHSSEYHHKGHMGKIKGAGSRDEIM